MKVYHYTSFTNIGNILGKIRGEQSGLVPGRKVGLLYPTYDNPKAVFGLLEPTPDSWVNNSDFPVTWETLVYDLKVKGSGALLLEAEIDARQDRAFVGDRAHLEGVLYLEEAGIPSQFLHEGNRQAERAFINSMIPIDQYVAAGMEYSLPEVVILNKVPHDRITVSSQQPLIEDDLANTRGEVRERLIHLVTKGWAQSELSPWRCTYESRNGPLEQLYGGKEIF